MSLRRLGSFWVEQSLLWVISTIALEFSMERGLVRGTSQIQSISAIRIAMGR